MVKDKHTMIICQTKKKKKIIMSLRGRVKKIIKVNIINYFSNKKGEEIKELNNSR